MTGFLIGSAIGVALGLCWLSYLWGKGDGVRWARLQMEATWNLNAKALETARPEITYVGSTKRQS